MHTEIIAGISVERRNETVTEVIVRNRSEMPVTASIYMLTGGQCVGSTGFTIRSGDIGGHMFQALIPDGEVHVTVNPVEIPHGGYVTI